MMKKTILFKSCLIEKKFIISLFLMIFIFQISSYSQEDRKVYLNDGTIEEQLEHVISKSSNWDIYKLILNDWVTKLRRNTLDSLNASKNEIAAQKELVANRDNEIAELQSTLQKTRDDLNLVQKEKNSITLLGVNISKGIFLSVTIIIVIGLAAFGVMVFGLYKRSFAVINKTQTELDKITQEFETHRQEARKKQEQLVVQHHKEIQRLKGI